MRLIERVFGFFRDRKTQANAEALLSAANAVERRGLTAYLWHENSVLQVADWSDPKDREFAMAVQYLRENGCVVVDEAKGQLLGSLIRVKTRPDDLAQQRRATFKLVQPNDETAP